MSKDLDDIDLKILNEIQADGRITNVELAKRVGISPPPCLRRVRTLEEEGYIRRDATKPRALELTDTATVRGRSVPLVGRVTAGMPILAQQNIEEYYMLPQNLVGGDEVFILSVQGESMIEAVRPEEHEGNGHTEKGQRNSNRTRHSCQTARKVAPRSASNVDPLSMLRGEEAARRSWCGLRSRAGSGSVVCGELRACS